MGDHPEIYGTRAVQNKELRMSGRYPKFWQAFPGALVCVFLGSTWSTVFKLTVKLFVRDEVTSLKLCALKTLCLFKLSKADQLTRLFDMDLRIVRLEFFVWLPLPN